MFTLIVAAAHAAPCAAPTTAIELLAAIGTAETAFIDIDLAKFESAQQGAETALSCLGEPLYPPDAAAWHRMEAMTAFVRHDDAASIAGYRSSFALQPNYTLPDRIAPNGHPLRSWFDAARVLPATSTVALPASGVALYVDGTRAASYPADRPFVLQAMDPAGRIQATAAVAANGALPTWATAAAAVTLPPTDAAPTGAFGSASVTSVPAGTTFLVRDLHADDAYVSSKSTIVGLSCIAGSDLSQTDGPWWGGSATCNGNPFYFYKVAFDVTGAAAPAAFGSATAPDTLYPPTKVTLRDIADDDLYAPQRSTLVGQTCTVTAELHRNDGAWYGGDVTCPDAGGYYYFYKVAFDVSGEANATQSTAPLTAGSSLVVQDIAPDDAYYPERASIIGQSCTVASSLTPTGEGSGWYGGDVNCTNGSYYYFYKMKFTGGGESIGRFAGSSVPKGAWVTIADVSSDDVYGSFKGALVGQVCQVKKEDLYTSGEGWFSGTLKCATEKIYFYQVGVYY